MLRDSIKSQDKNEALHAVDFHIAWSRKLPAMFPQGSEASISNGSDARAIFGEISNGSSGLILTIKKLH